jgi:hypothetical protein
MATYDLWRLERGKMAEIQTNPGSNWWFFRMDFSQIPLAANDVVRLAEIKNHWVLKCAFSREFAQSSDASSVDFGTSSAGNEIDNDIAIDSGTDTWLRSDTLDDDAPIAITADGYLYATMRDAACDSGILDLLIEVVIPPTNVDDVDNYGN